MVTTEYPTTIASTDAAGSTIFITSVVTGSWPTVVASTPTSSSSSSSHTAAIVGGAVGGGVVALALAALFFFCLRRRRSLKDEFDGDFDPDRVIGHSAGGGTLPQLDLADEVTPIPQPYTDRPHDGSMRQYGDKYGDTPYATGAAAGGATSPLSSPSHYSDGTSYYHGGGTQSGEGYPPNSQFLQAGASSGSGAYPQQPLNLYGAAPADWHTPRPMASPPPSTVASATTGGTGPSARSAKEREAMGRGGQGSGPVLGLATQHEVPEGSEDVVVHQDAGRAPSDEHAPREIPPSYDSIRS
jgi:hypothetical protein